MMSKITEIRERKGRGKRAAVYVDGRLALTLDIETIVKESLRVENEIVPGRLAELAKQDQIHRCHDAACRLLGYRPRSEAELTDRLAKRGFDSGIIAEVMNTLKEQGLIDDRAFAQFWTENRESFRPRSQSLTRRELKQKGLAEDVIDQAVGSIDDEENAYIVAGNRVRRMAVTDYQDFRKRLGDYLRRRGFSYETINHTIEKIWRELKNG